MPPIFIEPNVGRNQPKSLSGIETPLTICNGGAFPPEST